MLLWETAPVIGKLLLLGRFPESRWRSALGEVESVGNCVATSSAAAARACSRRATATWMVWFASSVCFSRADSSSLSKTLHHSPLATPSLGALSRPLPGLLRANPPD